MDGSDKAVLNDKRNRKLPILVSFKAPKTLLLQIWVKLLYERKTGASVWYGALAGVIPVVR